MNGENRIAAFARQYRDALFGFALLLFFLWVIVDVQDMQLLVKSSINAKFWPTLVGISGGALSLLLMFQGYAQGRTLAELERSGARQAPGRPEGWMRGGNFRSNMTILLIVLYMLMLQPAGWIVSTFLYLSLQFFVLLDPRKRSVPRILLVAFLFTAVVYIIFRHAFILMLPPGTVWNLIWS